MVDVMTTDYPGYDVTSVHGDNTTELLDVHSRYNWIELMSVFCPVALSIDRYVTPIWYFIGLHGNLLSAKIWLEKRMRANNSSAIYLATMSISDLLFLGMHIFMELKYAWGIKTVAHPVLCEAYFWMYLTAQYLSPLLVLGFSVERWIAVCQPFQKEKYCTPGRAKAVVCLLVFIAVLLCSMQAYFWTYSAALGECDVRPAALQGPDGRSLWQIWTWFSEMLIFLCVPLVTLCFNLLVIREVRRLSRQGPPHLPGHASGGSTSRATTVMLLSVSFYLIFTTMPATLVYALYEQFPQGETTLTDAQILADETWHRYRVYLTSRKIVEEICLSHYACNIFLYAITGQHFRTALMETFHCGTMESKKKGSYSTMIHRTSIPNNYHNNTSKL